MAEDKKEESKAEAAEEKAEAKEEKTEEKEVEVPKEFKDLVEKIEKMTVLELSELVKVLEDKFGVSAAAPVAVAGAVAGGGEAAEEDEGGVVNVELTEGGGNKIGVIKALRGVVQDLGLKEAKEMVEGAPVVVKEAVEKEEAEEIKKQLEEAGAKVSFK
ncbi:MAG: 50S ribosomal protein L7/L12 [Candidatus Spechtbacterales bacterium]|nr:50S ribosomal protein L7/L12 [Candidatus Spechtbacterales bacterium]